MERSWLLTSATATPVLATLTGANLGWGVCTMIEIADSILSGKRLAIEEIGKK